ncbi:hypothetical protein [Pseudomonas sp.]|nr:hypothetical protein [Pseudomonas sp.]
MKTLTAWAVAGDASEHGIRVIGQVMPGGNQTASVVFPFLGISRMHADQW